MLNVDHWLTSQMDQDYLPPVKKLCLGNLNGPVPKLAKLSTGELVALPMSPTDPTSNQNTPKTLMLKFPSGKNLGELKLVTFPVGQPQNNKTMRLIKSQPMPMPKLSVNKSMEKPSPTVNNQVITLKKRLVPLDSDSLKKIYSSKNQQIVQNQPKENHKVQRLIYPKMVAPLKATTTMKSILNGSKVKSNLLAKMEEKSVISAKPDVSSDKMDKPDIVHYRKSGTIERIWKDGARNEVDPENLVVIEEALNLVGDEKLRDKALKALEACGIGFKRHVPLQSTKDVHDSSSQTTTFGLFEDDFVLFREDVREMERKAVKNETIHRIKQIDGPTHFSTCSEQTVKKELKEKMEELDRLLIKNRDDSNEVQKALERMTSLPEGILRQWREDYDGLKNYDQNGFLGIHRAVMSKNIIQLKRLMIVLKICKKSIDIPTECKMSSLELAIQYKANEHIVKLLLEKKAAPVSDDIAHKSALIIACIESSPHLSLLIKYITDTKMLNCYDIDGYTPLHHCAMNNNLGGLKTLIDAGVDIDAVDLKSGRTALIIAVESQHPDIVSYLLEHGANPSILSFAGHNVAQIAENYKDHKIKTMIGKHVNFL